MTAKYSAILFLIILPNCTGKLADKQLTMENAVILDVQVFKFFAA